MTKQLIQLIDISGVDCPITTRALERLLSYPAVRDYVLDPMSPPGTDTVQEEEALLRSCLVSADLIDTVTPLSIHLFAKALCDPVSNVCIADHFEKM